MRFISTFCLSLLVIITFTLFSCSNKIEDFVTEPLSDYVPLQPGKYITYRLDSLVFTNFGRNVETHSYQVKHVVDGQITDNLGRPSYRIFTYLNDSTGSGSWIPNGSYFITPLSNQVEVIENNLRFVKLHSPIRQDYNWKGNTFLPAEPYSPLYDFVNDDDMDRWDYYYENLNDNFAFNQQILANVVNVVQVDDRFTVDTVDVIGNQANIRKNSTASYIRGNASDTIRINALKPDFGYENLTIYNRTNFIASLDTIKIPPGLALNFEFYNDKWSYPNPLTLINNKVSIVGNPSVAYILDTNATDTIEIDFRGIDTFQTKQIKIYNKSNYPANFNNVEIPVGYGRHFELQGGQWALYNNIDILLDKDPYSSELPFGSTTYSVEKYAKNIGLVFKELIMWNYQPNSSGSGAYKIGFGITIWMIDHN